MQAFITGKLPLPESNISLGHEAQTRGKGGQVTQQRSVTITLRMAPV